MGGRTSTSMTAERIAASELAQLHNRGHGDANYLRAGGAVTPLPGKRAAITVCLRVCRVPLLLCRSLHHWHQHPLARSSIFVTVFFGRALARAQRPRLVMEHQARSCPVVWVCQPRA